MTGFGILSRSFFLYRASFILVVIIVAASAPFTHSYKPFDFTTMAGAPNPDAAVFWFTTVIVVISIVVRFMKMQVKLFFAPATSFCIRDACTKCCQDYGHDCKDWKGDFFNQYVHIRIHFKSPFDWRFVSSFKRFAIS